ncbi:hypothetical protein BSKO_06671 [Bryopsis sp. KO-2023]|nr:hypothetical protein BSKO_06671 [Bryopsis sp. KO-2023]
MPGPRQQRENGSPCPSSPTLAVQYHLSSIKICWDGDEENPAVNRDNETPPGLLSDLKDTSVGQQQKPGGREEIPPGDRKCEA